MNDNLPDETLMLNVKRGELAHLSPIFERYNVALFNFFMRMGLDRDTSQDLTQNLFYRVLKYRSTYREGSSVRSWIYQMARNLHADFCAETKKRAAFSLGEETNTKDIVDYENDYSEDDFERLEQALGELPDSQREIIVLSRYQGLRYEDISSITGQSVPAIKVAMHRALKLLRTAYFKYA